MGYVLFYGFERFAADPLYLFRVWEGGMSFHGGFLGVLVAMVLFGRRYKKDFLTVTDFLAPPCPIGLGLGRLGNFINMELPGRVTDSSLGLVFQCQAVGYLNPMCFGVWEGAARHPSSLYQAATEGALLFGVLWWLSLKPQPKGVLSGAFLLGYGLCRFMTEFFRSPDAHIGFVLFEAASIPLLSLPMVIAEAHCFTGLVALRSEGQRPCRIRARGEDLIAHPKHRQYRPLHSEGNSYATVPRSDAPRSREWHLQSRSNGHRHLQRLWSSNAF